MTDVSTLKQTPITSWHIEQKARMAEFAGYNMPIQYTSVIEEHQAVRENVGLFDVAHMGLLRLEGVRSCDLLDIALTRDIRKLKEGRALYALMCQEDGGTVDDLIVYCSSVTEYYLVLNASNKLKDFHHLNHFMISTQVRFEALFEEASILALQGPKSLDLLATCGFSEKVRPFDFKKAELCGIPVQLAFTGYTGETGCEIFVASDKALELWKALISQGSPFNIKPCGLAARDTLRLEMGYSLYGNELSESINPIEAGLDWAVDFSKGDFIGKEALNRAQSLAPRSLIALKSNSKQAPRSGMRVFDAQDRDVGHISSGSFAPSLGHAVALAFVEASSTGPYKVEIRNQKIPFESTARPFYKKA